MVVANTIDDHCTRALLKKCLDACEDLYSIDTTEYKLVHPLYADEIASSDDCHAASEMHRYFDSLSRKHDLRVRELKIHLLKDHRLTKPSRNGLIIEWTDSVAA